MKNTFDGLIGRLGLPEERIRELEDKSIKASQVGMQGKKNEWMKKKTQNTEKNIPKSVGPFQKVWHMHIWINRKEENKEKDQKKYLK